jgi:hypothetical protein
MIFALKAEISDPRAKTFALTAQKPMYGGKHIAAGDVISCSRARMRVAGASLRVASSRSPRRLRKSMASPGKRRV